MLLYPDTCIVIYLVEEHHVYCPVLKPPFPIRPQTYVSVRWWNWRAWSCRSNKTTRYCWTNIAGSVPSIDRRLDIPREVFLEAAALRARHGLRTPDALHMATASHHGCDILWTNNDRLSKVPGGMLINVLAGAGV